MICHLCSVVTAEVSGHLWSAGGAEHEVRLFVQVNIPLSGSLVWGEMVNVQCPEEEQGNKHLRHS